MKNQGLKGLLCLCVALLAFGCSDDKSSDDKNTTTGCTATVCSGESLIVCNADGTTTTQACANGCDAATNQCKADSGNQGGNNESGGNQGGNEGGGNESGGNSIVNENILAVPASQDNTNGAECDEDSFVEHCSGENMVICADGMVAQIGCDEMQLKCLTSLEEKNGEKMNVANCYEPCTKEGDKTAMCVIGEQGADILLDVVCAETSNGLLLWEDWNGGANYCATSCENNTCETNQSCGDVTEDGYCSGDSLIYCKKPEEGDKTTQEVIRVIECDAYGMSCGVNDDGTPDCVF